MAKEKTNKTTNKISKKSETFKKSQSGQALIEMIVLLLFFLIPFVLLLFSTAYLIYSKEISSFKLYRTLICTEELEKTAYECKQKALKDLRSFLFFHKDLRLKLNTNRALKTIVLKSKYQPLKENFMFSKSFSLNLTYRKELKIMGIE